MSELEDYETIKIESADTGRYSAVLKELVEAIVIWEQVKGSSEDATKYVNSIKSDLLNLLVRETKFQLVLQSDFIDSYTSDKLKSNKATLTPIKGGK